MDNIVDLAKVQKSVKKLPSYIKVKLLKWAKDVEKYGLKEIRKVPGYHDEPLKGKRIGQRSIRLSKSYRAIYTTNKEKTLEVVVVEEVNKHEY